MMMANKRPWRRWVEIESPTELEGVGDKLARLSSLALGTVSLLLAASYLLRPAKPVAGSVSVFQAVGYSVWGWGFLGLGLFIMAGHVTKKYQLLRWAHPTGFAVYIGFSVANVFGSAVNVVGWQSATFSLFAAYVHFVLRHWEWDHHADD